MTEREKNRLHQSASENKLLDVDDLSWQGGRVELSSDKWSTGMGAKMLCGKVREWGKAVTPQNRPTLQRKYKLAPNRPVC